MLLRLVLLLPAIGASLRLFGFKRSHALLERTVSPLQAHETGAVPETQDSVQRIARLVDTAARQGPYRATCLHRSLALWWLLRRRGVPAELRIGVRKQEETLQAHAWVEYLGKPLGQAQPEYLPFADLSLRRGT